MSLFSTGIVGVAIVTATAGTVFAQVTITMLPPPPPPAVIMLVAGDSVLAGGSTSVTATVLDSANSPLPETLVTFSTTLGAFGSPNGPAAVGGVTDLNGRVTVFLFSTDATGIAQISATAGAVAGQTTTAFVGVTASVGAISGTRGHLRLLDEPPTPTPEQLAAREIAFPKANPPEASQAVGAIPPPSVPPTPLPAEPDPVASGTITQRLTAAITTDASTAGPSLLRGTAAQEAPTAAGEDFAIFRNALVIKGHGATNNVGEPTVHNIGPMVFQTGNWYAALSANSGISWRYLNPLQDTADWPAVNGGFCCDQVVLTTSIAGQSILIWLLQYSPDATGNTIRIVTYEGREALERQDSCVYDFNAQDHFEFQNGVWLDFTQLGSSSEWLYASTNAFESGGGFRGAIVWRLALADLVGGYSRGCTALGYDFWSDANHGSLALTVGADSTMYWAAHHGATNTRLRLSWVEDGSSEVLFETKNITAFPSSERGESDCTTPDGNNPCARGDRRISAAWTGDGVVGFMWTAAQGSAWAYPHIRVARFRADDRSLIDEPHFYSQDFGWVYPGVGVNGRGDLGGVAYAIGREIHPRAYAIIADSVSGPPSPWELHALRFSDDSPANEKWGDFATVTYFEGCANTWLAGIYTMQGGGSVSDTEHRFVWFGREQDRCANSVGGADSSITLQPGWNLVGWGGSNIPVDEATSTITGPFTSLFTWDGGAQAFRRFDAAAPAFLNTLSSLVPGDGVWILIPEPDTLAWLQPPTPAARSVALQPGFSLVMWSGPEGTPVAAAVSGMGSALTALWTWDAVRQQFLQYSPDAPAFLNTLDTLDYGDGVWILVSRSVTWPQPAP